MSDRVCLIYATCNRGDLLARSLARVAELTLPDEIIVVDDGGSDNTEQVCRNLEGSLPIRYVYTHHPGLTMCSHAKNVGIRSTDCELVITSEPEMLFETDVVAQMLARHEEDQVQVHPPLQQFLNVGRVLHEQGPGGAGLCLCCGQQKHETVNWQALWVTMFRREWLLSVGGWDEAFPEPWGWDDVDLGSRLRIRGVGQYNILDAVATHQWHPSPFRSQSENEAYFKGKGFHSDERPDHPNVIANQGREWGVPIPR